MKKPILSEDRACAIIQWNAAFTLINSLEQRLAFTSRALSEAQAQLKLTDRSEIDSLYGRIEQLTELLENKS